MEVIQELIHTVNDFLWTYLLLAMLLLAAGWFTWRTRFVQFRYLGEMFRLLWRPPISPTGRFSFVGKKPISSFQAFAVSVASRVGTGNLAGVASAIYVGGAGAIFWMWLIAILGSATAFMESTLAQLYKRRGTNAFTGGPAYYISYGLKCPRIGAVFSVLTIIGYGFVLNALQSNTIAEAFHESFAIGKLEIGLILGGITLLIIFGGIQRIARASSMIVAIMATGYVLLTLVLMIANIEQLPRVFTAIIESAFGWGQFAGGAIGACLMQGIRRGVFSNEAGMGSSPNAAATATVPHPVCQGLIQALGVFTDTLLICSCTAFVILLSGAEDADGIRLTQTAFNVFLGEWGSVFVAIAIFALAYSTIIANYYYGETNVHFFTKRPVITLIYRLCVGGTLMGGALVSVEFVWSTVDLMMAFMAFVNLIALAFLGKYVYRLLDDYRTQRRKGIREPKFYKEQMPDISDDLECW